MTDLALAAEFPPASREAWLARVAAVLKGSAFEDKLVTRVDDAIAVEPLYGQRMGARTARTGAGPWTVFQRVDHPKAEAANAQALDDLGNGATGLTLVFAGAATARGHGIAVADLTRALDGVALHAIALRIEGSAEAAQALAGLIASQPLDPARLDFSFGLTDAALAAEISARGFTGPFLDADGRSWHEKGATAAEELGAVLATVAPWLDAMPAAAIAVTLAAGQDMFLTLAKFRAMRLLWARLLEANGVASTELRLHGETSFRMTARLDPHTNILRATAAVFGAGLGGADSIAVLPFSIAQGLPDRFARRIARNAQNILLAESNLWRVADPASGAGYVEHLTEALGEKAWGHFRRAMAGNWPEPDPARAEGLPMIGTSAHLLPAEYPPAIEALS